MAIQTGDGIEEISPVIFFPIPMMNAARSDRGGLISIKVLAIFPDTMTPQQMIESQQDNPVIQSRLLEHFDTNPGTGAHLEKQAYDRQQQRLLAHHPEVGGALTHRTVTSSSLSPIQPTEESEFGSVTLDATFRVGQMAILNEGSVISRADIEAEKVFLASLYEDVILQSKKERVYSSPENFIERISALARIHVQEILKIYSGQNVIMVGAQTYSGVLTHIKALANIIDEPLELVTQHVEYHYKKGRTRIQANKSTLARGNHSSGGGVIAEADHNIMLQATTGKAPKFEFVGGQDVHFVDAHETTSRQIESTKKGSFKKTKTHRVVEGSSTSVGVHFEADEIQTTALKGNITATNPTFAALETNLKATEGLVELLLGVNSYFCQSSKSSNSLAWNRGRQRTKEDTTYAQPTFTGTVNINSRETLVQLAEGQANEFFGHIKQHGGVLETRLLKELHRSEHKMVQGPGQALISLVALALSMVTAGAGAAIAGCFTSIAGNATAIAMIDVAVTQVASQLTIGTAQNGGNALKGVKTLLNKDFLKNLAVSVASAGVAAELGSSLKIKKPDANFVKSAANPTLLAEQLKFNAVQQGAKVGVKSTLGGQSFKRNFREGAKDTVVDTAAAFAANKAGQYYAQDKVGYIGNKAMHFGIGFGLGYSVSTGDRLQDGLTAGGAAVVAEVTAEALGKGPGQGGGDASGDDAAKRLRRAADWGRFAAACAAFASGRDVDIAIRSATNAVENNFLATSPLHQKLDSEEEAAEDPEAEAARKNKRLSAEEIKKRFGERIRIHRDVTAFFYDREECLKNWIEEVFTESPPSPRTRARVEEDWGARYEKLRLTTNLGYTPRTARLEWDLERGEEYFIQERIKEFVKGQNLTPEEADHRQRAAAEQTLKVHRQQQAAMLVGGAVAVAHTSGQTARLGRNLQTGRMESKGKERDAQPQSDRQKVSCPATEGKGSAKNVVNHEKYKANLRKEMEKPYVENPELKAILNDLYRENAKIGSGSTAAALRHERLTGEKVGGKLHEQKALDSVNRLENWLDNNLKQVDPKAINPGYKGKAEPTSPLFPKPGDIEAAENVLKDLKAAYRS